MTKNIIKYIMTFFLSFLFVYILADKIILPYVFYVKQVKVPDVKNHNLSTAKILIENEGLKIDVQYVTSNKYDHPGIVQSSNPTSNMKVKKGTTRRK